MAATIPPARAGVPALEPGAATGPALAVGEVASTSSLAKRMEGAKGPLDGPSGAPATVAPPTKPVDLPPPREGLVERRAAARGPAPSQVRVGAARKSGHAARVGATPLAGARLIAVERAALAAATPRAKPADPTTAAANASSRGRGATALRRAVRRGPVAEEVKRVHLLWEVAALAVPALEVAPSKVMALREARPEGEVRPPRASPRGRAAA